MFCNLIFFPIHIYNLQYNTLAKKELYEHFFSEDLPRWLGSFSLPWSLWAGKRRTLNSTKNRGFWDFGFDMNRFLFFQDLWDFIRIRLSSAGRRNSLATREYSRLGSKIFQAKQSDRHTVCLESARSQSVSIL